MRGNWTAGAPLPGGDFPWDGVVALRDELLARYAFLPTAVADRLVRAYGTLAVDMLGDARTLANLGRDFGAELTEREVDWLVRAEFAQSAEDILWRRSKLGLRLGAAQRDALATYLSR
jgi:glycerol-3-phosphate dehydrogenase